MFLWEIKAEGAGADVESLGLRQENGTREPWASSKAEVPPLEELDINGLALVLLPSSVLGWESPIWHCRP